jgi:3D-(3,5/4)-trihydroxycyclohexane-1,2-dione acylhydrolase (decyclizing)
LKAEQVININADPEAALHYGKTIPLVGEAGKTLKKLVETLKKRGVKPISEESSWLAECTLERKAWTQFKEQRYQQSTLFDNAWKREVLTQPAAIKAALDWAKENEVTSFFDAGDVQANGFQIAENDRFGQTFTDGGASYMGFAASALLATALTDKPFYGLAFCGDGSFTMNPQILIDGVEHGARGCILVFDNRRMAAISGLQTAQYGCDFATHDTDEVDYVAWARAINGVKALPACFSVASLLEALNQARAYPGLSLIHIPVYYGPDELGGLGAFGRWNVGNWSEATQAVRHEIGL